MRVLFSIFYLFLFMFLATSCDENNTESSAEYPTKTGIRWVYSRFSEFRNFQPDSADNQLELSDSSQVSIEIIGTFDLYDEYILNNFYQ
ncbi:MAG: hypothetical protein AB7T22_07670 [Calditrichaceae bacterium]